jgi:predicted KAP-like P-loop ATPase
MKLYFYQFKKYFSFIQLLKYSTLLASALILIDITNFPSKYLLKHDMNIVIIVSIALLILILLTTIELHLFDSLKIISINIIDALSATFLITSILYTGVSILYSNLYFYKIIVLLILSLITVSLIIVRAICMSRSFNKISKYQSNVVDLKDIYTGNFSIEKGKSILVNEKDVDYDLLERTSVINLLHNTLLNSNPSEGFVISLEGDWGSGKTTIINNVKRNLESSYENIIVIDDLDPWSYSNQESLFYNMFDTIIQKSGIKFSPFLTKQMADSISGDIFGNKKANLIKNLFIPTDTINTLKNRINDYLKFSGKKLIFFIDNIDRTESENIILLFKLVGNVFDFERVIYVLSFDNNRVKKILENNLNIDYQYLKKIIQMQIRVPALDKTVFSSLIIKCLNNLLIAYGETRNLLGKYEPIIKNISNQTKDIRDFKRFINSVVSMPFSNITYLNKRDLFAIEYIRLNNLPLYETIYKNRIYFISHDKHAEIEIYNTMFDKKMLNDKGKEFFDTLFDNMDNKEYIFILEEIFPYVKKYNKNQALEYDGNIIHNDPSYKEISKNKNICSAKYFELYFSNTKNDYLVISNLVEGFVSSINTLKGFDEKQITFSKFIENVHYSYLKEMMEKLQLYIDEIQNNTLYDLTLILYRNLHKIDDTGEFFSLSSRSRTEIIIWELLQKITDEEYNNFIDSIREDYKKIDNISKILYWFEHDKEEKNISGREQKLKELYQNMGVSIINQSINLYDDNLYSPKNIWALYRLYKDDNTVIKQYIKDMISENNIFRLLYDIIGFSIGSSIKYSISSKNISHLTTIDEIDEILKNTEAKTEDQEFILEVYKNYKQGITDEWGEAGIISEKILHLKP